MINVFITIKQTTDDDQIAKTPQKRCGVVTLLHKILEFLSWKCYIFVHFMTIRSNHYLWPLAHLGPWPSTSPLKYALALSITVICHTCHIRSRNAVAKKSRLSGGYRERGEYDGPSTSCF